LMNNKAIKLQIVAFEKIMYVNEYNYSGILQARRSSDP